MDTLEYECLVTSTEGVELALVSDCFVGEDRSGEVFIEGPQIGVCQMSFAALEVTNHFGVLPLARGENAVRSLEILNLFENAGISGKYYKLQ